MKYDPIANDRIRRMVAAYEKVHGVPASLGRGFNPDYIVWSFQKAKAHVGPDRHPLSMTDDEWETFLTNLERSANDD